MCKGEADGHVVSFWLVAQAAVRLSNSFISREGRLFVMWWVSSRRSFVMRWVSFRGLHDTKKFPIRLDCTHLKVPPKPPSMLFLLMEYSRPRGH